MRKKYSSYFIALGLMSLLQFNCTGQVNPPPPNNEKPNSANSYAKPETGSIGNNKKDTQSLPTQIVEITNDTNYAFNQYVFYNTMGEEIKRIAKKDFPKTNPVYDLNFPKNENFLEKGLPYFKSPNIDNAKSEYSNIDYEIIEYKVGKKIPFIKEVDYISADPGDDVFFCFNKHLIRVQNATLLNSRAPIEIESGLQNSVLDCSTIEIYDSVGNQILITHQPFGRVDKVSMSDDGLYLLCSIRKSFNFWEPTLGADDKPYGMFILDVKKNSVFKVFDEYFSLRGFGKSIFKNGWLRAIYADGYFQIWFRGDRYDELSKVYLDIENKKIYMKEYKGSLVIEWLNSPMREVFSFSTIKGISEDLNEFISIHW